jgi:cytochrome c peroxidase
MKRILIRRFYVSALRFASLALIAMSACDRGDDTGELRAALEKAAVRPANAATLDQAPGSGQVNPRLLRRFEAIAPRGEAADQTARARVDLGRMLYFDVRLSKDQDVSCNTCHRLDRYGVDNEPTSIGHRSARGTRNAPTVYNASESFVQFWDGRAATIEEQALGPILNPAEMGMDVARVLRVLKSMPGYVRAFSDAFPSDKDPVTIANLQTVIGAFERGLVTPSRWDDYLNGNQQALSQAELSGLKSFTNLGCMVCHTGRLVGGSMYQKVGVVQPWPNQGDPGRYAITRNEADRMVFRVPTLRNVARTAPYFHDGSAKTLPDAIRMMGKYQLGLDLDEAEVTAIATWLDSLTGKLPTEYIQPPALPPSTSRTPKPDLH